MKIMRNTFTIADLNEWMKKKSLIVNKEYQRGKGLWPINARSYFLDSILNQYPFPKITIRQSVDLKTKKSIREIIDGQQRMTTIRDFIDDKLTLSKSCEKFYGKKFSQLDNEIQNEFLGYEISVDTVIAGTEDEILEIFRRMNSYTLPLNEAEKRHATYQGEFKWFIKDLIKMFSPLLENYKILTTRQISRMQDADLMTELCQIILKGIVTRNKTNLDSLYKNNETKFDKKEEIREKLTKVADFMKIELNEILEEEVLKGYSFYSLVSALIYNKWGIQDISSEELIDKEDVELNPVDSFCNDINGAIQGISELFSAVDQKNEDGTYGEFVKACSKTTHSITNRKTRLKWLSAALQGKLVDIL